MPSLIRFILFLGILAGLAYVGMIALDFLVDPSPREMTIRVPAERVNP
jgi:hypothetical protein